MLTDLTERDPTTHQAYRQEEEERVKTSVRHAHESIVDAVTRGDAALAGELPTNETNRATVSAIKPAMPRRR